MRLLVSSVLLIVLAACSSPPPPEEQPGAPGLPFVFTRPAAGEAPSAERVTAFTRKITGFWKQVDYFRWASRIAHGLDASYDPKLPPYLVWWGQVAAEKSGDTVTFVHGDWDDNLTIEMSKLMAGVSAGYLATRDPAMRRLVVGFANGYSAFVRAMRWGGEPPDEFIWARAVYTHDHAWTVDGRKAAVTYEPVRRRVTDWNAHTVPNETNPDFGSIWVRNMRSQDDVPHILRVAPWLARLEQDAPDDDVRKAAGEALGFLRGFARDVVAHGFVIRSKEDGVVFTPDADLASFVYYDGVFPDAQCNAKLALSLVANGAPGGIDCGDGTEQRDYEAVAGTAHYYAVPIYRYFHVVAVSNALASGQDALAKTLLEGLAQRFDAMATDPLRAKYVEWEPDRAATLLAAAATGLPLTGDEAALVHAQYDAAVDFYAAWPLWDLWSPIVADGRYPYVLEHRAGDVDHPTVQEMAAFLEYCESPWRNPAGAALVDCDVVRDPSRWGE